MRMKMLPVSSKTLLAFWAMFLSLGNTAAYAISTDDAALVQGAKLCTQYLPRHERQYGIPEHLLAAIASTESGRFHRGLGLNLPWPWTINVNGRGYFFDTKEEAVAEVTKLQSMGYKSIDVGCMQVNLHHHPKAFNSVEQAFDPAYNVGYAASFLKRNFMEEGSWRKATGDYHSKTVSFGSSYAEQVFGTWSRIVNKVADARAGRPVLNNYAVNSKVKPSDKPTLLASKVVKPSYRSVHMRMISVTSKDKRATRENGVLVIRPEKNEEIIIAQPKEVNDSGLLIKAAALKHSSSPSSSAYISSEPETKMSSKPKIINIASKAPARGQFTPKSRNSADAAAMTAPVENEKTSNKLFVFDN